MCYDLRMTFRVEITETLSRVVEVESSTAQDAEEIVRKVWKQGGVVLDAGDFVGADFRAAYMG